MKKSRNSKRCACDSNEGVATRVIFHVCPATCAQEIDEREEETERKRRATKREKDNAAEMAGRAAMERELAAKRKQRSSLGSVLGS